jgi:hypothetical protein
MIENVLVRTSDPTNAGHIGIAMLRAWPGPCFVKNVEVQGFDYGIDVGQTQLCVTMEHVALKGQRLCGLKNTDNCLAIRDLVSHNVVPAVISRQGKDNRYGPAGLVVLIDSKLFDGFPGNHAIENAAQEPVPGRGVDPFGKARMGNEDEQRYYRYGVARPAAFCNVMFPPLLRPL